VLLSDESGVAGDGERDAVAVRDDEDINMFTVQAGDKRRLDSKTHWGRTSKCHTKLFPRSVTYSGWHLRGFSVQKVPNVGGKHNGELYTILCTQLADKRGGLCKRL
jgi:hemin uptake protein HemP